MHAVAPRQLVCHSILLQATMAWKDTYEQSAACTKSPTNYIPHNANNSLAIDANTADIISKLIANRPDADKAVLQRRLTKRFGGLNYVRRSKGYEMIIANNLLHLLPSTPDPTAVCKQAPHAQSKRSWEAEMKDYRKAVEAVSTTFQLHFQTSL